MKLGANETWKVVLLGALVLVGGYLKFSDTFSSSSPGAPASKTTAVSPLAPDTPAAAPARTAQRNRSRGQSDEFHPVLRQKRPEDRIDPAKVDPTLRLDLLAKLREVESASTGRNVFQFGPPPVKVEQLKAPEPKVIPAQMPAVAASSGPPVPPPPPPIPLKYYGFSSAPAGSGKTAFFLDGEDILVAKEGDTLKRRYRVVRVNPNSVVMEDTESKHQQTLPLEEIVG
jgi:hypothetical protein